MHDHGPKKLIGSEINQPIPRVPDGFGFLIHFPGGLRAQRVEEDKWVIEPVLDAGRVIRTGFFTSADMFAFFGRFSFKPVAYHDFRWSGGNYLSHWLPLIVDQTDRSQAPADLWGQIAFNKARGRLRAKCAVALNLNLEQAGAIVDDRGDDEFLAYAIRLSLLSMDISIEQVVEFYHDQLVRMMIAGQLSGLRVRYSQEQTLFTHVHSFFINLGAARDYLAALIALRLEEDHHRVDDMARLARVLKSDHFEREPMLKALYARGCFTKDLAKKDGWSTSGWLKQISEVRRRFVHHRPYGSEHSERFGRLRKLSSDDGVFRYYRPIKITEEIEVDILDYLIENYRIATSIFFELAKLSGYNSNISVIRMDDVKSMDIERG